MKYLRIFSNATEYNSAKSSLDTPHVALCEDNMTVQYERYIASSGGGESGGGGSEKQNYEVNPQNHNLYQDNITTFYDYSEEPAIEKNSFDISCYMCGHYESDFDEVWLEDENGNEISFLNDYWNGDWYQYTFEVPDSDAVYYLKGTLSETNEYNQGTFTFDEVTIKIEKINPNYLQLAEITIPYNDSSYDSNHYFDKVIDVSQLPNLKNVVLDNYQPDENDTIVYSSQNHTITVHMKQNPFTPQVHAQVDDNNYYDDRFMLVSFDIKYPICDNEGLFGTEELYILTNDYSEGDTYQIDLSSVIPSGYSLTDNEVSLDNNEFGISVSNNVITLTMPGYTCEDFLNVNLFNMSNYIEQYNIRPVYYGLHIYYTNTTPFISIDDSTTTQGNPTQGNYYLKTADEGRYIITGSYGNGTEFSTISTEDPANDAEVFTLTPVSGSSEYYYMQDSNGDYIYTQTYRVSRSSTVNSVRIRKDINANVWYIINDNYSDVRGFGHESNYSSNNEIWADKRIDENTSDCQFIFEAVQS